MDVPVAALDGLFDTFLKVQAQITANLEAHGAELGLNATQLVVVRDVLDHPHTSLKDLCGRCGLKKSAASRLVDALADRGLVVRTDCPTSRRTVALVLGPALGGGQFCRVEALERVLPGWRLLQDPEQLVAVKEGLDAFLRLAQP
jgi:hypothetical protein